MRRSSRQPGEDDGLGGGQVIGPAAPPVVVEVCTCGCTPRVDGTATHPEWPLAAVWAALTAPVEPAVDEDDVGDSAEAALDEDDEDDVPWWDARADARRRRALLPLVLLGELQAGVLLRAVYEVVQGGGGPTA